MTRVYVENVSSKADPEEVKIFFGDVGKIKFFGVKDDKGYIVRLFP